MPSFNVQNAKSLEITEGDVATIHDADGRQLWGKLNYTTKYQGDTEQTTYTGKNLLASTESNWSFSTATSTLNSTAGQYAQWGAVTGGQYYTASRKSVGESSYYIIAYFDSVPTVGLTAISFTSATSYETSLSITSEAPATANYAVVFYGTGLSEEGQLETGSTATTYEPYVGGIPSPNPDYPQPISVVTGTQTVTLTGGTVSEDYTVHLGTLELAKIGTYQDYIYKSNGNWYKHAEIEKLLLDGTEGHKIDSFHNQLGSINAFRITLGSGKENAGSYQLLSGHFRYAQWSNYNSGSSRQYATISDTSSAPDMIYMTQANDTIGVGNSSTSVTSMNTWFTSNNVVIYYALATATDTQITDTDLIAELDAIEEFMIRCGYTASVSGNLPIVINQTEIV